LNDHLYAVIMAGGIGSRLWPRSRAATPKQFLDILGSRTMLQETVARIEPLIPLSRILVVVSEEHAGTVQAQIPGISEENLILEPGPRGTAPCVGLAGGAGLVETAGPVSAHALAGGNVGLAAPRDQARADGEQYQHRQRKMANDSAAIHDNLPSPAAFLLPRRKIWMPRLSPTTESYNPSLC